MRKVADQVPPVTPYDGCGRCLVATRRLSRKTDKTASPAKQARQTMKAAADNGGHIIGWADDFEVSGATDPLTRPGFGPWLRGEMGPYDGVIASAADRIGRNVRDVLNTQALLTSQDRIIITADHDGVWDFTDPNEENTLDCPGFFRGSRLPDEINLPCFLGVRSNFPRILSGEYSRTQSEDAPCCTKPPIQASRA